LPTLVCFGRGTVCAAQIAIAFQTTHQPVEATCVHVDGATRAGMHRSLDRVAMLRAFVGEDKQQEECFRVEGQRVLETGVHC
jgi:hypothetical protein